MFCVITRLEISRLKNIVHQIDSKAFVVVHDVLKFWVKVLAMRVTKKSKIDYLQGVIF